MEGMQMQDPGGHKKMITPDVNPEDVHKAKFTKLVLTLICILPDTLSLQDTPHHGPVLALGGNGSLPDFYFGEDEEAFLLDTVFQPKDCHLEAPTLAKVNIETPTSTDKPFSEKLYPIRAGDCFKDEKVSEDDEASQEEKLAELLISQVEYRSLAKNITVPLLSLPESLPPEEPGFSLQPQKKSCLSKGFEDKCLPKWYHLESFGSLALTEVNPGQSSFPDIIDGYIQPGHFTFDLNREKVCSNDVEDFKDDKVPSLTEPEEIRCIQDKDQSLIPLSSECCSKDEETEKDLQEAESVCLALSPPEPLSPEDPGINPHGSSYIPLFALIQCKKDSKVELLHPEEIQETHELPLPACETPHKSIFAEHIPQLLKAYYLSGTQESTKEAHLILVRALNTFRNILILGYLELEEDVILAEPQPNCGLKKLRSSGANISTLTCIPHEFLLGSEELQKY
ncbi:hypothetical protein DSO57_1037154 [Entomophthora muscae]|uniref:Uncharacterized protein n=1 Tax=Entomophthora muscae TaxID=34485 RepID=A0ACC2S165_9FUNG|nr:hypothetical protein DSO57_1037154 [Entomophthora muscae]